MLTKEYPFQQNYFVLNDNIKMNYLDEGKGEVVILLHGNPTWSFYYRNVVKELKKSHRVIVPDHIGCGFSDKPQNYSYNLKQHIENIKKLLIHLNIDQFSLVAHDWGGAIGMGVVISNEFKIKKIALLNTASFISKDIPFRILICKAPIIGSFIIRSLNGFAAPATWMAVTKGLKKDIRLGYLFPYSDYKSRIAIDRFVQDIPLTKKHPTFQTLKKIEDKIPHLSCPVKLFWGDNDFCFNQKFLKKWLSLVPHAQHQVYLNSGHYVLEDAKDEIIDDLCNYLRY